MSDPLALISFAVAASGGRIDDFDAAQLIAAGTTLLQRSAPLVRALSGRRSAILLPTDPAFLTALSASDGRAAVLLNPLASASEIAYQVGDASVGAVFTTEALASRVPEHIATVLLDDAPRKARLLHEGRSTEIDLGSHFALSLEGDPNTAGSSEDAVVIYTSAMNGFARGARLTHRNILSNARATVAAAGITQKDHSLALLPFSHLFGLVVSATAPLLAGARVTTMDRFNPVRALDLIAGGDITMLVGVPAVYRALLHVMENADAQFTDHQLRVCICGGAPLDVSLQDRWFESTRVELRQGYGLTEAGPVCLFNDIAIDNRRGSMGRAFPGVELTLKEPGSNKDVASNEIAEICVRGDNVFSGYINDAKDALQFTDNWLHTGDLAVRNEDGSFEFRGVSKDMFTRNGFNIYPREIERVVETLSGVEAAHAYAIPNPIRENDIGLEVTGNVSVTDVKEWCAIHLGAYKQPSTVSIVHASS